MPKNIVTIVSHDLIYRVFRGAEPRFVGFGAPKYLKNGYRFVKTDLASEPIENQIAQILLRQENTQGMNLNDMIRYVKQFVETRESADKIKTSGLANLFGKLSFGRKDNDDVEMDDNDDVELDDNDEDRKIVV